MVCSHIRSLALFRESVLNLLEEKLSGKKSCEFTTYSCPKGLNFFEKGECFPEIAKENSSFALNPLLRFDIGHFGENVRGEGVMYFSTKESSQFCGEIFRKYLLEMKDLDVKYIFLGTQLQMTVNLSPKTLPIDGVLRVQLLYHNRTVVFNINCE